MATQRSEETDAGKVWTIAEAQAKLAEILKLAEHEGPQRIGAGQGFVIVPEAAWRACAPAELSEPPEQMPMDEYLLTRMPRGIYNDIPPRGEDAERPNPFVNWDEEEWDELGARDGGKQ